ncbi:hypothetical protein AGLY_001730 [Aphis glycines]|uniref:Uncharacterized protein n=1 Tax=Aphis glycines TaxID=307491 RepID=A0A6G0U4J1_APHGL|nr:hypothetical protein AGLY_001730 [Aphis glycines]
MCPKVLDRIYQIDKFDLDWTFQKKKKGTLKVDKCINIYESRLDIIICFVKCILLNSQKELCIALVIEFKMLIIARRIRNCFEFLWIVLSMLRCKKILCLFRPNNCPTKTKEFGTGIAYCLPLLTVFLMAIYLTEILVFITAKLQARQICLNKIDRSVFSKKSYSEVELNEKYSGLTANEVLKALLDEELVYKISFSRLSVVTVERGVVDLQSILRFHVRDDNEQFLILVITTYNQESLTLAIKAVKLKQLSFRKTLENGSLQNFKTSINFQLFLTNKFFGILKNIPEIGPLDPMLRYRILTIMKQPVYHWNRITGQITYINLLYSRKSKLDEYAHTEL